MHRNHARDRRLNRPILSGPKPGLETALGALAIISLMLIGCVSTVRSETRGLYTFYTLDGKVQYVRCNDSCLNAARQALLRRDEASFRAIFLHRTPSWGYIWINGDGTYTYQSDAGRGAIDVLWRDYFQTFYPNNQEAIRAINAALERNAGGVANNNYADPPAAQGNQYGDDAAQMQAGFNSYNQQQLNLINSNSARGSANYNSGQSCASNPNLTVVCRDGHTIGTCKSPCTTQ